VREWLRELDVEDRKVIGDDIKTVELGWPIGMPLVRKWRRTYGRFESTCASVLLACFSAVIDDQMVLLHGFVKKSQQTP
jgi:phage-related protein